MGMEGIKDTLATDLLKWTMDTISGILNSPGDNSIIIKSMMMNSFSTQLEERMKEINLVYTPSTNTFCGILEVDVANYSITIDENRQYAHTHIRDQILSSGEKFGIISSDLSGWMRDTNNCEFGCSRQIYADYMMYKLYVSHIFYDLLLGFVFETPGITIPYINPHDPDAYVFLSLNMNRWWDSIANRHIEKLCQSDTGDTMIPWIKPTIIVRPDLSFKFYDINIIDMTPVFEPYDET